MTKIRNTVSFVFFLLLITACDPPESLYSGPPVLYIGIDNQSGMDLYEKDNWGKCDEKGNIFPSERVIQNEGFGYLWWYMDGIYRYAEFIKVLENKCPNAYVELYAYDGESQVQGSLLKKWTFGDNNDEHCFFDKSSLPDHGMITGNQSMGLLIFTILPSDVGIL